MIKLLPIYLIDFTWNLGSEKKHFYFPHCTDVLFLNDLIWSLFLGYKQRYIKAEEGLSHHYRICEFGGFDCLKKTSISDPTAAKWGPNLIPNIDEKCNQIFGNASCPPAPPLGSPWWRISKANLKKRAHFTVFLLRFLQNHFCFFPTQLSLKILRETFVYYADTSKKRSVDTLW